MKIYRKDKGENFTRWYLMGIKLMEKVKNENSISTYLLGLKIRKVKNQKEDTNNHHTCCNIQADALNRDMRRLQLLAAEQKILSLGLFYASQGDNDRYIICFDCLADAHAEAIDAWTMFKYLQSNNIPSRYVILKQNALYKQLEQKNELKDIVPVASEMDFLLTYPDVIAQSKVILSSFGFGTSRIFKQLPTTKYVFIEHGVMLLKVWVAKMYGDNGHLAGNKILVPSKLTKDLYDKLGIWQNKMYFGGLPRWDNLTIGSTNNEIKKIFIFFTYRATFNSDSRQKGTYLDRISKFVHKLNEVVKRQDEKIEVYLAPHHALLKHDKNCNFDFMKNVNIVSPLEISKHIKTADLFVTDFSSACFDLLYRNIPTIFYCFDTDVRYGNFRDNTKESAKMIEELLYNCYYDLDSAISKIEYYINNDFKLESELLEKNNNIFWNRGNNCERLLQLINDDN